MEAKLTIAGINVELKAGRDYTALRVVAPYTSGRLCNVEIFEVPRDRRPKFPELVVSHLSKEKADQFISEFNTGVITIAGRYWE